LEVRPQAALFACRGCGVLYEVEGQELRELQPRTAAITTELAVPPEVHYLAVWTFLASVEVKEKRAATSVPPVSAWAHIRDIAAPRPPFLFVPAFAIGRIVVQQLGVALVEAQPELVLKPGIPPEGPMRPVLVEVGRRKQPPPEAEDVAGEAPAWTVSPVMLSREDAETLAHFVYLAVENRATPDLRGIDYDLSLTGAELLFLPAVFDKRYVRDSNWRFLLREFDGLVA
jgi:hypothetical protein